MPVTRDFRVTIRQRIERDPGFREALLEVFPNYRNPMKGVDWGGLYERLKDESLDPEELETGVVRLMIDDDVTKKAGIYPYLLTGGGRGISAFEPSPLR